MRHPAAVVLTVVTAFVLAATAAAAPPPGASARCRDGTYSFSQHRSGTCSHHRGVAVWLATPPPVAAAVASSLGRTVVLAAHVKTSGCRRGTKPDRRCSPGAYDSALTKAVICAPGFRTTAIRNVPDSEKHAIEVAYGMAPKSYGRTIEIDHIVSLELGGSNAPANLFPEPHPSYHLKDKLENRLHDVVCAGGMTLRAAQRAIATDWVALYRRIFGSSPVP